MKDWEGAEVTEQESPDQAILIWEIDPHPNPEYDVAWVRGYQDAQEIASQALERMLEEYTVDELKGLGVCLTVKLREVRLSEYLEVTNG